MAHDGLRNETEARFSNDYSDADGAGGTFDKPLHEIHIAKSAHSGHSGSDKGESVSFTYTDVRAPQHAPPSPVLIIPSAAGLAQEIAGEGFCASAARISGGSPQVTITETIQSQERYMKEQENYRKDQEALVKKYEKAIEKMHEDYRKKTEAEADKIRKEMEKQHDRDITFRKELMDKAIERQKEEIALEAKYARKELERQREMASDALDRSKKQTDVQVNLDTAAGHTVSESQSTLRQVECEQDALTQEIQEPHTEAHKSLGSKIKETLLGKKEQQ